MIQLAVSRIRQNLNCLIGHFKHLIYIYSVRQDRNGISPCEAFWLVYKESLRNWTKQHHVTGPALYCPLPADVLAELVGVTCWGKTLRIYLWNFCLAAPWAGLWCRHTIQTVFIYDIMAGLIFYLQNQALVQKNSELFCDWTVLNFIKRPPIIKFIHEGKFENL